MIQQFTHITNGTMRALINSLLFLWAPKVVIKQEIIYGSKEKMEPIIVRYNKNEYISRVNSFVS